MAKRIIFNTVEEVKRASAALKDYHVEHIFVNHPAKDDIPEKAFIVVMNKNLFDAQAAIQMINLSYKIHGARHYKMKALTHKHYKPTFECICRGCGKKFQHPEKYAKWCSKECKKDFRNKKREQKHEQKNS